MSNHRRGGALSFSAIADSWEKRLGTNKVHQLRHTFAQVMEDRGAKVSEIQRRLGHASAATTSISLQALRSDANRLGEAVTIDTLLMIDRCCVRAILMLESLYTHKEPPWFSH